MIPADDNLSLSLALSLSPLKATSYLLRFQLITVTNKQSKTTGWRRRDPYSPTPPPPPTAPPPNPLIIQKINLCVTHLPTLIEYILFKQTPNTLLFSKIQQPVADTALVVKEVCLVLGLYGLFSADDSSPVISVHLCTDAALLHSMNNSPQ